MDRKAFVGSLMAAAAGGALGTHAGAQEAGRMPQLGAPGETLAPRRGDWDRAAAVRTLGEHRIAKIESWRSEDRYLRNVGPGARGKPSGRGFSRTLQTVTTDKGVGGFGMSDGPKEKIEQLVGQRVSDVYDVDRGASDDAIVIDLPLHDLVGRILGLPVYALLGARGPTRVPVYSGAIHFEDLMPTNKPSGMPGLIAACRQDYEAGYRAFKIKIGRGQQWMPGKEGARRDIEATRAIREQFPDCRILVDANDGYTVDDFLGYVTAVADCDLLFIEEPFRENRDDLVKLRDHMSKVGCAALIAEGEGRTADAKTPWKYGHYTREHMDRLYALAAEDLVDVFVLDLALLGYTRWRNAMPELVAAGIQAAPHTWAGTPRPFYTAHLAAGAGNVLIVEGIPGAGSGLDYSAFRFADDGNLVLPNLPGFGIERTS